MRGRSVVDTEPEHHMELKVWGPENDIMDHSLYLSPKVEDLGRMSKWL